MLLYGNPVWNPPNKSRIVRQMKNTVQKAKATHLYQSHVNSQAPGQSDFDYLHSTACGYVRDDVTRDRSKITCKLCLRELGKSAAELA